MLIKKTISIIIKNQEGGVLFCKHCNETKNLQSCLETIYH